MTIKTLTGTYSAGYTLSSGFTGLSITGTGRVRGADGSGFGYGGGIGVMVTFAAPVNNAGICVGGNGSAGYPGSKMIAPGTGGDGGIGVDLTAGGSLNNTYVIAGGAGGMGGGAPRAARGGYGGDGVRLGASGTATNTGHITGGTGGFGGQGTYGGNGGRGGAGIDMAAGGQVSNSGTVIGGLGGGGFSSSHSGSGGDGGAGVEMSGPGTVTNHALIEGGVGGAYGVYSGTRGLAGHSGAAVLLNKGGTLINYGAIYGGAGYAAGYGGAGAVLAAGGSITNKGPIRGGQAGYDGVAGDGVDLVAGGTLTNSNLIVGGASKGSLGKSGAGVSLANGGTVHNVGTIIGGAGADGVDVATSGLVTNGGATNHTALIYGAYGVSAGPSGAATVLSFGSIQGAKDSVRFQSAKDRLIVEPGAVFIGTAVGGGGTLEFAGNSETVTNLGAAASMGGSLALYLNGFGTYQIDAAASWTFLGGNVLNSGDTLIDKGTLSLSAGSSLTVANAGSLQFQGTVANGGTIDLASTGANTDLRVLAAGLTLSGGGMIEMSRAKARILGLSTAAKLTNVDNTIIGAGFIGAGSMTLVNDLTGQIQPAASATLTVDTKGATFVNNGRLYSLDSGAQLVLVSTTIDQTGGGVIASNTGGVIKLQGVTVIGGAVFQNGTGVIEANANSTLDGTTDPVQLTGVLKVLGGVSLTLDGQLENLGMLDTFGGAIVSKIVVGSSGATFAGGGEVNLSANANNIIVGAAPADTLTNVDNRISGGGDIGAGSMALVNETMGVIVGSSTVTLTLDTGANKITNAGLIAEETTGSVVVKSAVLNTGTLSAAAGTLTLDGAVTGGGVGLINTGVMNLAAAFGEIVTFISGATGQLRLADFKDFTGTVRGFSKTGANSLDLVGFTLTGAKASYSGTTAAGTLTVSNGSQTAVIKLAGNYIGSTFTLASDGHGGVLVKDPSAEALAAHMAVMPASAHAATSPPAHLPPRLAPLLASP